ncbi:Kinesin-like protein [Mycena chlorophos]|uniref:Nucleoside diphosphate kinase n=1 Tax=Mycena chlorophos TaxID=658473 RepID=A0A8H6VZ72_MYCCL|nr:Kinesin-like protein [Mycena chlorophos]
MSSTGGSPPLSPEAYGDEPQHSNGHSNGGATPTMTVAMVKTHALQYRFDIEKRIQEASFEIVKERQMEFDVETDPDTLYELFGEDAETLGEGPTWVYVLERRRAVEVWNTLMGPADPEAAKAESPNSLRALYGTDKLHNAVMGSADNETAEMQIASLFASSPVFPLSDLPDDGAYDEGYAASNPSTTAGRKSMFKARALPSTHEKPDIVPRMSRAAAIRAGLVVVEVDKVTPTVAREPLSKEKLAKTFANVPGHKRAESIAVASTAAPTIAPRMTRAAALRLGLPPPAPVKKTAATNGNGNANFDGVPGHKRRETITVASVAAPTVAPRLNKSAALRASKDNAPPSSFQFKAPGKGLSRSNSVSSLSYGGSSRPPSRPASAASMAATSTPKPAARPRPSSVSVRPTAARPSILPPKTSAPAVVTTNGTAPERPKPRPSSVSAPSIAPRTNRSAALRAAKQEAENAAAAAAAARKNPRPKPVPTF